MEAAVSDDRVYFSFWWKEKIMIDNMLIQFHSFKGFFVQSNKLRSITGED